MQRMHNTKQVMQRQGHMDHKMSQELPVGMHVQGLLRNRLCVPLFLAGVFDSEELHVLNRGHKNGLSSCRLGCHLGSRFGCTLRGNLCTARYF